MVSAQLLKEARSLPPQDRWILIGELQQSLEEDSYQPSDPIADQMADRFRDYQAGNVNAIPWDVFRATLERDLRS